MEWTTTPEHVYALDYAGKYKIRRIFPLWWEIMSEDDNGHLTERQRAFTLTRAKSELRLLVYEDLLAVVEELSSFITRFENEVLEQGNASLRDISEQDGLGAKQAKLRHYKEIEREIEGLMADVWINGVDHLEVTGEDSFGFTRIHPSEFRTEDSG